MLYDKDDKTLLQNILQEHFSTPLHKNFIDDADAITVEQKSPTCSDNITLQIKFDNKKISWAKFEGQSCSISSAATDILCDQFQNITLDEAKKILDNYHNLITGKETDEELLDELIIFHKVFQNQSRINCALLSADGFKKIISQYKKENDYGE